MDDYGRVSGRVIGLLTGLDGEIVSVGVELSSGEFSLIPSGRFSIGGDSVVTIHSWAADFQRLTKQLNIILGRTSALERLYSEGDVSKEVYDELRGTYDFQTKALLEERQRLLRGLKERNESLKRQERELRLFLTSVSVSHTAGETDDATYQASSEAVGAVITKTISEERDVESMIEAVMNTSAPPNQSIQTLNSQPFKHMQPIVLRIKDAEP